MRKRSFFDRFIIFLAGLWKVDNLGELLNEMISVDAVVMVAHGATKTKLTNGAIAVTAASSSLKNIVIFNFTDVYFGFFDQEPNWQVEMNLKKKYFPYAQKIGKVLNTIGECQAFKRNYIKSPKVPKNILVITDEAHSRRCKIVWKTFFPDSKIYIITVPIEDCVDPESPMETYHKLWKILWNQAWPTPIFWFCSLFGEKGLMLLNKYHQPITEDAS